MRKGTEKSSLSAFYLSALVWQGFWKVDQKSVRKDFEWQKGYAGSKKFYTFQEQTEKNRGSKYRTSALASLALLPEGGQR